MNIGLLNTRISIQKNELVVDSIGNHKNIWKDYYKCYATVSGESGNEDERAGQTVENVSVSFTIRFCTETAALESTKFRIVFQDELYDIVNIDHMNYKKKCLKLKCQKVKR